MRLHVSTGKGDVVAASSWGRRPLKRSDPGQHCTRRRTTRLSATKPRNPSEWVEQNLDSGAVVEERFQGGSSWSSGYVLKTANGTKYFVKTSRGRDESMFKGEALGLNAMHDTGTIVIPKVFHYGGLEPSGSFIVMEYLDMGHSWSQAELGKQLALMHLATPKDPDAAAGHFGFPVDNTIGGTPQYNGWMDNWVEFFRERRLKPQLELADDSRLSKMGKKLCSNLDKFFEGVDVRPSVLHGDLWSGNIGGLGNGQPTIFDPATYYGHSEAEFGMSWCAGFSPAFYEAYHQIIPKAPGFEQRRDLFLFYHYCNHYNLFGSGYYGECERTLQRLTRDL